MTGGHRNAGFFLGVIVVIAGLATIVFGNLWIGLIATLVGIVAVTASHGARRRDAHRLAG
jgi:nicotinamide riboside transporter PnuC